MLVMQQKVAKKMRIEVMIVAPMTDFVALTNTWMNGNPFFATGASRRASMSPRQKQNATNIAKPRVPLTTPVAIIALGSV